MMNNHAIPRIGILGATGYTGREALRLLAGHPRVALAFATSQSAAGTPLRALCRTAPEQVLVRAEDAPLHACDAVLCCLPHGESAAWVRRARGAGARVVDLSADLRVPAGAPDWAADAVYGLPELHREQIRGAALVANPGCYPTATLLALAPLLRAGLVAGPVVVNAASGVTGAGRTAKPELLFAEVAEDFRAYGLGNTHRHLGEMRDQAARLAGTAAPDVVFVPHLLPVRRGILATVHVPLAAALPDATALWAEAYAGEPFVEVFPDRAPSLRDVVGSNRAAIGVFAAQKVAAPMLTVVAAVDNLLKGAAGQAVQNLNLMLGCPEGMGLQ